MLQEFKKFAIKGNVMDMAVGIIIGVAFGSIVSSFVADVMMPPLGLLMGNVDFSNMFVVLKDGTPAGPYVSLAAAKEAGAASINIGIFINTIINFVIVAFAIFIMVKWINSLKKKEEEAPSEPPKPSNEEMLLGEIRDLLKAR